MMDGKKRCAKLKAIRKAVADKIGVDLHQVECTWEGECKGTCPKCKQEEDILNKAILTKGATIAGAAVVATSLAACTPGTGVLGSLGIGGDDVDIVSGGNGGSDVDVAGYMEQDPEPIDTELSGDVAIIDDEDDQDLAGAADDLDERDCTDDDCTDDKDCKDKGKDKDDGEIIELSGEVAPLDEDDDL